jgi:hypothetical protein
VVEDMVVEFYRDHPKYKGRPKKYIWYCELFDGIEDQENRIVPHGSNGYGESEEIPPPPDIPIKKSDFFFYYLLDGEEVLSISNIHLRIKSKGQEDMLYTLMNDPETVRLTFAGVCQMEMEEKIVKDAEGNPSPELSPSVHSIQFLFDTLPSDEVIFVADIIGLDQKIIRTETGTVKIVPAPWDESQ